MMLSRMTLGLITLRSDTQDSNTQQNDIQQNKRQYTLNGVLMLTVTVILDIFVLIAVMTSAVYAEGQIFIVMLSVVKLSVEAPS